jgi:hypothetical protein
MINACVHAHWKSILAVLAIYIVLCFALFRKHPEINPFPLLVVFWTEALTLFCIFAPYDRTLAAAHAHILFLSAGGVLLGDVLGNKGSSLYMSGKTAFLGMAVLILNALWAVYLLDSSDMLFLAAITGMNLLILASVYLSKKAVRIH